MSDKNSTSPTNQNLRIEQTEQGMLLKQLCTDVHDIKVCLMGTPENRDGLLFEVDRLKSTSGLLKATVWVIFTAIIGLGATAIGSVFMGK